MAMIVSGSSKFIRVWGEGVKGQIETICEGDLSVCATNHGKIVSGSEDRTVLRVGYAWQ